MSIRKVAIIVGLGLMVSYCLLSCTVGKGEAPITIVQDGNARAVIMVAAGDEHGGEAAAALQKYIEKISGAKLEIVTEGAAEEGEPLPVHIYVGHTAAARENGIEIPSGYDPSVRPDAFEEEGYVLESNGGNIFIGGNSDGPYLGTIYGAYAFLEKLGCRWYFPGEWGEVIAQQKTVTVGHLDIESRPDFAVRYIGLNPGWVPYEGSNAEDYRDWCKKVGFRDSHVGLYPNVGDGFMGIYLPAWDYFEEHPEYYAMDKSGKRHVPTSGDILHNSMLCLSNPDVCTQVVKNIEKAFAEKHYAPGHANTHRISKNGFGLSPPDGSPYCFCPQCDVASQKFEYDNYVYGPQMSEEFFSFAKKLAGEFPDKYVATMAYSLREMPPQGVELLPNMTIYYAPISSCALHNVNHKQCWRRQEYASILAQHRRQTPHVYLYEYNPNFLTGLFVPEPSTANAAANIPYYKKLGIKGINAEGRKAFMQTWTSYYVMAKLLWDADTDVEALKEELYRDLFGAAAGPHVQAWWDAVEEGLGDATIHVHEDFLVNNVYTVPFTQNIHRHIEDALKAEATEVQRGRVKAVALIADHLEAYAAMEAAEQNLDYAAAGKAAQRMFDDQAKLNKINSFFISETFPTNDPPPPFIVRWRVMEYKRLLAMTDGETGQLVAPLPLEMKFVRDPYNEGMAYEWYGSDFDDKKWGNKNTFLVWEAQDPPEDEKGHQYDGWGWYRGEVEVPDKFAGEKLSLHLGGALNEAWVWVNGQYVGHQPHKVWWWHPHSFDMDISDLVEPGKTNTVAIRIWNKAELGGLFRRGFLWSPKEVVAGP